MTKDNNSKIIEKSPILVCGFCYGKITKEKVWRCGDAPEIFCKKECGLRFMRLKKQSSDKSMEDYAVRDVQEMLLNENKSRFSSFEDTAKQNKKDLEKAKKGRLVIERKWAMPNKWTFTIKPIKELMKQNKRRFSSFEDTAKQNKKDLEKAKKGKIIGDVLAGVALCLALIAVVSVITMEDISDCACDYGICGDDCNGSLICNGGVDVDFLMKQTANFTETSNFCKSKGYDSGINGGGGRIYCNDGERYKYFHIMTDFVGYLYEKYK